MCSHPSIKQCHNVGLTVVISHRPQAATLNDYIRYISASVMFYNAATVQLNLYK